MYVCLYILKNMSKKKKQFLAEVKQDGLQLVFATKLQNDKEVVLAAVNQCGWALEHASAELRNDKEVVLAAVNQNGWALRYASQELQNDKEVVLAAVTKHGSALENASEELQNNKEVCLVAVWQNKQSYEDLNESMHIRLIRDRLTATKLSILNANVGAEYGLPDEMVEEVCKYVCPIRRIKGSCKWQYNMDNLNLGMLYL
jgi:hypothetical protein